MNTDARQGKSRFRVDIEFRRVQEGPRPSLLFEAKRLGPTSPVSKYLGEDGLGCFLSGDYPVRQAEAGMLGYIQSQDEDFWASKIQMSLSDNPTKYALHKDGRWAREAVIPMLKHTFRTRHLIHGKMSQLTIYHVLLRFC